MSGAARPVGRQTVAIILVLHGSRTESPDKEFRRLINEVRRTTAVPQVEIAYCEVQQPGLASVIEQCVTAGAEQVVLFPGFMQAGKHLRELRQLLTQLQQHYPDVTLQLETHLGAIPGLGTAIGGFLNQVLPVDLTD